MPTYGVGLKVKMHPAGVKGLMLVPDRVDLPLHGAASWDPRPWLPEGDILDSFNDPTVLDDRTPAERARAPAGRPTRTHCTDTRALLERMDCAGMLEAEFESVLEAQGFPVHDAAGLFAVDKGGGRQRLVSNRKARNAHERSLGVSGELFPHASQLTGLTLGPGEKLRGSGDDLPDYYHMIATPPGRWFSNQVGPSFVVDGELLADFGAVRRLLERQPAEGGARDAFPGRRVRMLQRSLPMGDVNATDYGEVAHLNVLDSRGALDREAWTSYRRPLPRGRLVQTIMIDDHNVHYKQPAGESPATRGPDDELLERADAAYSAADLAPKPSKRFRKRLDYDFLGGHVRAGTWLSARREAIGFASLLTAGIARAGRRTSGSCLACTVALWTHAGLFRRPSLAFLDDAYREIERMGADSTKIDRLSRRAMDELHMMASLQALLGTDLSAPVDDRITATDASGGRFAGVGGAEGRVSPEVAAELWRHRRVKGLGGAGEAWCAEAWETPAHEYVRKVLKRDPETVRGEASRTRAGVPHSTRAAFGDVCDAVEFYPTFAYRPPKEHITLSETRAVRTSVRRRARAGARNVRMLSAIDSEASAHGLAKGRSTKHAFGKLLRSTSVCCLKNEIQIGVLPVPSAQQPADGPSRRLPISRREPKEWARKFVAGGPFSADILEAEIGGDPRARYLIAAARDDEADDALPPLPVACWGQLAGPACSLLPGDTAREPAGVSLGGVDAKAARDDGSASPRFADADDLADYLDDFADYLSPPGPRPPYA